MTATTNSQPLKILLQKCKSWDLIENIFLCLSLVLIDLQRHTVPHFKDKFIINNSFYQIEAIREKLLSLDLDIGWPFFSSHSSFKREKTVYEFLLGL